MSGMEKLSDLLEMAKVSDIIATKKEKEDNKIVWALAIIRSDRSSCRNRICGI